MSRTKFFLSNSAAMGLQYVVALAAALIIPRLIIVTYGSDINGLIVSVTQFAAYFLLVEAGISGAAVYALYKPLALGDAAKINGILSAAKRFYFQSGWIFTALVAALAILYPLFTKAAKSADSDSGLHDT